MRKKYCILRKERRIWLRNKKKSKKEFEALLWRTQSKQTPKQLTERLDQILEMNGEEREKAMKEYFLTSFKEIFKEGFDYLLP